VPYRLPLIPRAEQALAAAREAGAWAATISGSGSGLLALCARGAEHAVAQAMARALHDDTRGAPSAFGVRPDLTGATLQIEA
jgi:homoserine kinase